MSLAELERSRVQIQAALGCSDASAAAQTALEVWAKLKLQLPRILVTWCRNAKNLETLVAVKLVRDTLETSCLFLIQLRDIDEYESCWCLLEPLYIDYAPPRLPQSELKASLYALELLKRLVDGERAGDFHMLLQRLSPEDWNQAEVKFVIKVEQFLMSGNYEKAFEMVKNPPNKNFTFLCTLLIDSARRSIADCLTKSHSQLPVVRAKQLLHITSDDELEEFVAETNERYEAAAEATSLNHYQTDILVGFSQLQPEEDVGPYYRWEQYGAMLHFVAVNNKNQCIPIDEVFPYVLSYAAELERIV